MIEFVSDSLQNIARNGKNAGKQPSLLSSTSFSKAILIIVVKTVLRTKSVTKKEMNKCMAEIYDPGGI